MKTEVLTPKTVRCYIPYPNAASRREILHKIVDFCLVVACSVAIGASILCLVAFG